MPAGLPDDCTGTTLPSRMRLNSERTKALWRSEGARLNSETWGMCIAVQLTVVLQGL